MIRSYNCKQLLSNDTLSLEKAMQMALRNSQISSSSLDKIAEFESSLLTDICTRYYKLLYHKKCYKSILKIKLLVANKLSTINNGVPNILEHQMYTKSIHTKLDQQLTKYQLLIANSSTELFELVGMENVESCKLSDSFEPSHSPCKTELLNAKLFGNPNKLNKNKSQYNFQLTLVQQAGLNMQLAEENFNKYRVNPGFDYPCLMRKVNKLMAAHINYFTQLLKMKKIHITIAKLAAAQSESKEAHLI